MSYKVVIAFTDLQDNNYIYNVGDSFPHNGYEASEKRLKELSSTDNKRGQVLIKKLEDKGKSKPEKEDSKPVIVEQPKLASDKEVEKAVEELHEKKQVSNSKKKEK